MKQISITELRQHAGALARRAHQGESFEITERGRPIALLIPRRGNEIEWLTAAGLLSVPEGNLLDWEPLPAKEGVPLPSEILAQMRADER
jgi:prevent-host-death family protein